MVKALQKKGFEKDKDGKHITFTYIPLGGGLPKICTYVSHGSKSRDLNDYLIGKMAQRVRLQKKSFEELISCKIKQSEYEKLIKDKL